MYIALMQLNFDMRYNLRSNLWPIVWAYLKSYLSLDKRLEKDPTDTRCTVYGTGTDTGAGTGTYTDNDTDTRYGTGVLILILVVKGISRLSDNWKHVTPVMWLNCQRWQFLALFPSFYLSILKVEKKSKKQWCAGCWCFAWGNVSALVDDFASNCGR